MCDKNCGCKDCLEAINTSDVLFDGEFQNSVVPEGADLNDVLLLIEGYIDTQIGGVTEFVFTLVEPNPINLAAGTYGYQQIVTAILVLNSDLQADLIVAQTNIDDLETDLAALDARVTIVEDFVLPVTERYKVKVSQSSTSAPAVSGTFIDELSGAWSYVSVGNFDYTATGKFADAEKVFITATNNFSGIHNCTFSVLNANTIRLTTKDDTGSASNAIVSNMSLLIEVCP